MKVALGCALAAVVGWAAWWELRELPHSTRAEEMQGATLVEPAVEAPRETEVATETSARHEIAVESPAAVPSPATTPMEGSAEASKVIERLRASMERSLSERIDPNALLDAALYLVQFEASDRAVPEPDPSGAVSFPLLGLPEGLQATLRVGQSRSSELPNVFSLDIHLTDVERPYVVDGMPRENRGAA